LVRQWGGRNKKVLFLIVYYELVVDLILSLDPNHDGKITFDEFREVMKHIEERLGVNNQ
jgi:hypothetical protein